jgi:sulfur carrier protein
MSEPLQLIVNGRQHELEGPATVARLLAHLRLPDRGIAVELNSQIVPKVRHAEQALASGDRLEIVSLVGGG